MDDGDVLYMDTADEPRLPLTQDFFFFPLTEAPTHIFFPCRYKEILYPPVVCECNEVGESNSFS